MAATVSSAPVLAQAGCSCSLALTPCKQAANCNTLPSARQAAASIAYRASCTAPGCKAGPTRPAAAEQTQQPQQNAHLVQALEVASRQQSTRQAGIQRQQRHRLALVCRAGGPGRCMLGAARGDKACHRLALVCSTETQIEAPVARYAEQLLLHSCCSAQGCRCSLHVKGTRCVLHESRCNLACGAIRAPKHSRRVIAQA